ncbi:DUF6286 domain-containing protein [Corynebacterium lubricantis]|uniref:DUF6286 domain-containing protein n=1 Tax=Corynebacterium lubricantis TaxID=541095 RepID=UPI00035D7D79|nr:DUF6286 domain-containing protein [Corynebacterium lubricantis]
MSADKQPGYGQEPRAHPRARSLTLVIGVVLLVLAGIMIRDVWVLVDGQNPADGWLVAPLTFLEGYNITLGGAAIGILIALVGLWVIIAALRPRMHTHVKVSSTASIWMRPVDIARKSTATMQQEFGSDDVRSRADRKRLSVEVGSDEAESLSEETIKDALRPELTLLDPTPKVKVTVLPPAAKEF